MFKAVRIVSKKQFLKTIEFSKQTYIRTFLSQAYYCNEIWNERLSSPVFKKVVPEDLYHDLEQRYQKTKHLSAIDVDIFVNTITDSHFSEELLDLVHKLRLTADTSNTLNATSHAVVRALLKFGKIEDLMDALDDRLNYGLFIDYYTANILMDTFWKSKDFAKGVKIASMLMLQEEVEHPLSCAFSLLHCFNYLQNPKGWPQEEILEDSEDEVKIRVKFLRNHYDDQHFDLKDANKVAGKTLMMFCKNKNDPLHQSFSILGMALFGQTEALKKIFSNIKQPLFKEVLDLIPEDSEIKNATNQLPNQSVDINKFLMENVEKVYQQTSEKDIYDQCETFKKWEEERLQAFEEQKVRLSNAKRLQDIEDLKKAMQEKEEKLWFFDNEDQIDLKIAKKKKFYPKRWFGHKKSPRKIDETYIPPEVQSKQIDGSHLS
ncbi:uncharacterized protein LOC143204759 [Rhynchophorus ferrugineus]|uniref:Mitochondrial 28S ribosomal protein S27 n=1 Tax=Rhynchophorus ferrugineus TaxID=354439 RepID=A0A834M3U2_RHYFE|nr:hypothetical protein GWI33_019900 [Rhynchophorus ferrugineus]